MAYIPSSLCSYHTKIRFSMQKNMFSRINLLIMTRNQIRWENILNSHPVKIPWIDQLYLLRLKPRGKNSLKKPIVCWFPTKTTLMTVMTIPYLLMIIVQCCSVYLGYYFFTKTLFSQKVSQSNETNSDLKSGLDHWLGHSWRPDLTLRWRLNRSSQR